ncbi:hypothetical protein PIB30_010915 [Stylosanthes scabra]|uniref:Uncharacterized protein n=1 Tax=Stylosanthes scabra TaxID=79078 RepID=A0ABU6T5H5_9FABA|nr:hypothetical protein [Stylosanthes scabra]
MVDDGATKMRGGSCAGVADGSATWRKGEGSFHRRLQLTVRPPPLTVAVFPGDRDNSEKREVGTVAPPWMATGELATAAWESLDDTPQRRKRQLSFLFNIRVVRTMACARLWVLTHLQILGLQGVCQVQNKDDLDQVVSEVELKFSLQAQLDQTLGQQQLYSVFIGELHFKQCDLSDPFYFW